ncbi:hypothetical protein HH308_04760 [Gordonia sp. TBRC 11910]|uniref:Uncharacterized protein n=1 Tax=Gordonia asplenii TaxID=2725283 RepID=A0A848KNA0_9ACTN|nr:DUF6350 family protein [Gordonia asplenii]NMO00524.1 hypothetical protein [Gordonia asplenii]
MASKSSESESESLATRLRQHRQNRRAQAMGSESSARELVMVAFGLPIIVMVALTLIVAVTILAAGGGFGGIGAAVGSAWLVVHQVPLTIAGVTLGALPALPTIVLVVLAAKSIAPAIGERRSIYELGALFAAAIGGPLLITALAMAVVMDGESVLPVQSPTPLAAFGATALVHGLATVIAVAGARWRDWAAARGLGARRTDDIARGARLGATAVLGLLGAVSAVIVVMLLVRFSAVANLIGEAHSADGYLGLVILSVFYLPNLAVAGASALVGADVTVGMASLNLLHAHGGAIPPLPLLAVLPDGELGGAGAVGFVVTAVVAGYVGMKCRDTDLRRNLRLVAIAGVSAASIMVLAVWISSGSLGELGSFGAPIPVAGMLTFAVITIPGVLIALVNTLLPASKAARASALSDAGVDDEEYGEEEYDEEAYGEDEPTDAYEYDDAAEYDVAAEPGDAEYNEYYVDDFDPDDFDPDGYRPGYDDAEVTARIVDDDGTANSRRRVGGRGMTREDYEDAEYLDEDETEVTGRWS